MFRLPGLSVRKIASALLLAEMLFFALGLIPEHIATHASHDACEICAFVHHPPVLQTGMAITFELILRTDVLPPATAAIAHPEPGLGTASSRAPPSHV